jgi:Uma2 family endonuclease
MATTTSYVPVEVYLRSGYEPDADYVDGVIEERNPGQWDHATWQQAIQRWFIQHKEDWNVRVRPELRIQVSPTRFRVADVVVIDRSLPTEQIITHPPLAVFEVLSPDDTVQRAMRKLGDYAGMGIPQIWLVDPELSSCYLFIEGKLIPATHFGSPDERMYFAVTEIEAFLD